MERVITFLTNLWIDLKIIIVVIIITIIIIIIIIVIVIVITSKIMSRGSTRWTDAKNST